MARSTSSADCPTPLERIAPRNVVDARNGRSLNPRGLRTLLAGRRTAATLCRGRVELLEFASKPRAIANSAVTFDNSTTRPPTTAGSRRRNAGHLDRRPATWRCRRCSPSNAACRRGSRAAGARRSSSPKCRRGLEPIDPELLIVGAGRIGRAVGRRAEAFGMSVVYVGREDDIFDQCSQPPTSSRCTPRSPRDSRNIIDAAALATMKPGSILVNTGRGAPRRSGRPAYGRFTDGHLERCWTRRHRS